MNLAARVRMGWVAPASPQWRGFRTGACVATLMTAACLAQDGASSTSGNGAFRPEKANSVTAVNQRPDANRLLEINARRARLQKFTAANAERKRQMANDSARLLQLATELNAEVGRAESEGLLLTTAVKVDTIEKLAHAVGEKMKLTVAAP